MSQEGSSIRVIRNSSVLYTGAGFRKKSGRRVLEEDMGCISNGAMVYSVRTVGKKDIPHQILWVGPTSKIPKEYHDAQSTDLQGKKAVVPGFVDCHTHLVFAGNRADEFAQRCGGVSYQEIAQKGGGIQSTVNATRSATREELFDLARKRLQVFYDYGVRTIEIKSGYGLSHKDEMKCLDVVSELRESFPEMTLLSTYLGAHAFPKDQDPQAYFKEILNKTLPLVADENKATACDIFVDEGYFTRDQAKSLLEKAKSLGLQTKIHADELGNTESASLAAELGCLSADHLLQISDKGIQALANSETVAVLLPGTAFYLKAEYAPARKLIDSGAIVALSTDFNPGSCNCPSLPVILTISALYLGMTRAELLNGVTYAAAKALGLENKKGTLEVGYDADFTILPFSRFEEVYYQLGWVPS